MAEGNNVLGIIFHVPDVPGAVTGLYHQGICAITVSISIPALRIPYNLSFGR